MDGRTVAVINCGNSSIKYELFSVSEGVKLTSGLIEKILCECSSSGPMKNGRSRSKPSAQSKALQARGIAVSTP